MAELAAYGKEHKIRMYLAIVPDVHNLTQYQLGFAHDKVSVTIAQNLGYKTMDLLPAFLGH